MTKKTINIPKSPKQAKVEQDNKKVNNEEVVNHFSKLAMSLVGAAQSSIVPGLGLDECVKNLIQSTQWFRFGMGETIKKFEAMEKEEAENKDKEEEASPDLKVVEDE